MLVLTREKNQSIMIGQNVEVIIIGISNKQVRLGISAPRMIPVHRKEIYEAISLQEKLSSEIILMNS